MQLLRLPVVVISSAALLLAQMPQGFAQNPVPQSQTAAFSRAQDTTPSPAIVGAFKAHPKGGDELSKRIEDIIVGDPNLAPGLAKYVQTAPQLNIEQKRAAFNGLAAALNRMGINAADMPVKAPPAAVPPPVADCPALPDSSAWAFARTRIVQLARNILGRLTREPPFRLRLPHIRHHARA
jgi:hypothetical protein